MSFDEAEHRLASLPSIQVTRNEPLSRHTRFELGGPATLFADTDNEATFVEALRYLHSTRLPWLVIGLGTNLVVADRGYRGVVLRYRGARIEGNGDTIHAQAGATLQDVVDLSTARGLQGMESMTGIPGNLGAAIYGNAGAYGASMSDIVRRVRYFDGEQIREADHAACGFRYRGSIFKQQRLTGHATLILSADLVFKPGDSAALQARADDILTQRNRKFPPEMKCAGSIFKNLILAELSPPVQAIVPASVVKGGKVPAAWFLEEAGAKGLASGGIRVTDHHSNTLYNAGNGTAAEFLELTAELKRRVRARHNFNLEEEVQTMGFEPRLPGLDHLESTPFALQSLLTGLTPDQMLWTPADDRWSIAQVLAHLAHGETNCYHPRLIKIVHEDNPELAPYHFEPIDPPMGLAALEDFLQARRSNLAALASLPNLAAESKAATTSTNPTDEPNVPANANQESASPDLGPMLARTARHPRLGTITLEHFLNEWAFHDLGHLRQIAELVRAVKYYPRMGPFAPEVTLQP